MTKAALHGSRKISRPTKKVEIFSHSDCHAQPMGVLRNVTKTGTASVFTTVTRTARSFCLKTRGQKSWKDQLFPLSLDGHWTHERATYWPFLLLEARILARLETLSTLLVKVTFIDCLEGCADKGRTMSTPWQGWEVSFLSKDTVIDHIYSYSTCLKGRGEIKRKRSDY